MKRDAVDSPYRRRPYTSLKGRSNFRHAFRAGAQHRIGAVTILQAPGDEGRPQVGIVAGKKVGNAVERNRAKRRIRAALAEVPLRDGTTYVVIASRGVIRAGFGDLVEWLRRGVDKEME